MRETTTQSDFGIVLITYCHYSHGLIDLHIDLHGQLTQVESRARIACTLIGCSRLLHAKLLLLQASCLRECERDAILPGRFVGASPLARGWVRVLNGSSWRITSPPVRPEQSWRHRCPESIPSAGFPREPLLDPEEASHRSRFGLLNWLVYIILTVRSYGPILTLNVFPIGNERGFFDYNRFVGIAASLRDVLWFFIRTKYPVFLTDENLSRFF
jgi:hypothetical protein